MSRVLFLWLSLFDNLVCLVLDELLFKRVALALVRIIGCRSAIVHTLFLLSSFLFVTTLLILLKIRIPVQFDAQLI